MSARRARAGDSEPFVGETVLDAEETRPGLVGRRAIGLHALFTAIAVVTRLPFLRAGFLNVDEAAHLLGSWELLRGGRLYEDFADNKPPLVYTFYAAAQLLCGPGIQSVRVVAALVLLPLTALAAAFFFGLGRRGVAAAIAFLVASGALLASDAHVAHCEHVALLPLAWSMVVLRSPAALRRRGRLFVAGALVGIASLAKQPAAAVVGAIAVAVLLAEMRSRRELRPSAPRGASPGSASAPRGPSPLRASSPRRILVSWGALAAGFASPIAVAACLFASSGTLRSAVFWVWDYNFAHIDNPMPLADKAARLAEMGALVVPAAAPLVLAALLARRLPPCGHRRRLPLLFAAATFPPALLGMRLFGHYFLPLLFALALAAAPFLGASRPPRLRRPVVAFGLFAFAVFSVVGCVVYAPAAGLVDVSRPTYERIGEVIREDERACEGPLFVWGYAPSIYTYAAGRPASRFVVPIDTLTGYLAGNDAALDGKVDTGSRIDPAHWRDLMSDLERRRPAHVVDTAPADLNRWGRFSLDRFPRLQELVRARYRTLAIVDGAVIYRRIDCDEVAVPH